MRNIIKLSLMAIVMFNGHLFAQNFGVKAGLNLSNLIERDHNTIDSEFKPGFHIGATAEFPIKEIFSFETGLLLSTKGYKTPKRLYGSFGDAQVINYREETVNLLYLDIPLTAKISFDVSNAKIYGSFGSYIGVGLSGKHKTEISYNPNDDPNLMMEVDVEWGSDENDDFKRLDYGLSAEVGVEFNAVQVGVSYSIGIADIMPNIGSQSNRVKNQVVGISLGFKFG